MAEALLRTITNYVVVSEEDYLKLKELGSLFKSKQTVLGFVYRNIYL